MFSQYFGALDRNEERSAKWMHDGCVTLAEGKAMYWYCFKTAMMRSFVVRRKQEISIVDVPAGSLEDRRNIRDETSFTAPIYLTSLFLGRDTLLAIEFGEDFPYKTFLITIR